MCLEDLLKPFDEFNFLINTSNQFINNSFNKKLSHLKLSDSDFIQDHTEEILSISKGLITEEYIGSKKIYFFTKDNFKKFYQKISTYKNALVYIYLSDHRITNVDLMSKQLTD